MIYKIEIKGDSRFIITDSYEIVEESQTERIYPGVCIYSNLPKFTSLPYYWVVVTSYKTIEEAIQAIGFEIFL